MSLTAAEICEIIKTCKKQGVTDLQYQGLALKFTHSNTEPSPVTRDRPTTPDQPDPNPYRPNGEDLEQLMVTDPVEYERWHSVTQQEDGTN